MTVQFIIYYCIVIYFKYYSGCVGHIQRRNWFIKHVIEGKIEVPGKRGRRRQLPLEDLQENSGYWKLKEEALERTLWGTRFF